MFTLRRPLFATLLLVVTVAAAGRVMPIRALRSADDCGVILCGPSGMFTPKVVPTIAGLNFTLFPKNPSRPYKVNGRTWFVGPTGNDQAEGTAEKPLATITRAVAQATAGDGIQVGDGTYRVATQGGSAIVLNKPGVTLFAETVGAVTLETNGDYTGTVIEASADNLIVDGFIIKAPAKGYGVYFGRLERPQRNLVLKNMIIDGGESGMTSVIPPNGRANLKPVIQGLLVHHVLIRKAWLIGFNCG